ncbi:hypothetical protein LZ31DRAFT_560155, partial [Colletotrichum somersetense]
MAEVFGVVVSALTVAEMAGKLGGSIIKLKKLWDEVQDVRSEITQLVLQLELLRSVLAEMESESTQQTRKVYRDSMGYCQQVVAELDALVEDLLSRIDTAKRSRRNITKLKATFKKEQIRDYQEKIKFALQLLSLSQQTYTISVVKSRFLTSPDPATQADATQTTTPQQPVQPEIASENTLTKRTISRRTRHELTTPVMAFRRASFFGGFVYRTVSDPDHPDIEVRQARVQLPRWISETFWDFQAYRAYTGWKVSLKPWTMRSSNDPIFEYVRVGSLDNVLKALESNEASLQDIDEDGWSLLHNAMWLGQHDISKCLIEMGSSVNTVDYYGRTALRNFSFSLGDAFSLLQYLLDIGELDYEIERFVMPEGVEVPSNLPNFIWHIPGVLEMIRKSIGLDSYYRLPLETRFARLDWFYVDPELLLDDIHKGGNLEPADFRLVLDFSDTSSLSCFTWNYFDKLVWSDIHYGCLNGISRGRYNGLQHWQDIARWVFAGLSAKDFGRMEKGRHWLSSYSSVFGGLVEWQYCFLLISSHFGHARPRFAQKVFMIWLEDLQAAGVDLAEYGRQELEVYLAHGSLRGRRWFHRELPFKDTMSPISAPDSGWRLVGFAYGPEPRDWKFTWDLDAWEYAGDFWERVENPPLHIPGGWVD